MQTLYLEGRTPLAVLLEGPALRLRRGGEADRFAPLGRLARIVVSGNVHWRAEALGACMDWNVPISFLDAEGRARGACVTLRRVAWRSNLPALFEQACLMEEWNARWGDWLRAVGRGQIRLLLRRFRLRVPDMRPASVAQACAARAAGDSASAAENFARMQGLLEARIAARLVSEGFGPAMLGGSLGGVAPARDLASVLAWRLWPVIWRLQSYFAGHEAKHRDADARRRRLVRFFEAEAPALEKAEQRLFAELSAFLAALPE